MVELHAFRHELIVGYGNAGIEPRMAARPWCEVSGHFCPVPNEDRLIRRSGGLDWRSRRGCALASHDPAASHHQVMFADEDVRAQPAAAHRPGSGDVDPGLGDERSAAARIKTSATPRGHKALAVPLPASHVDQPVAGIGRQSGICRERETGLVGKRLSREAQSGLGKSGTR